MTRNVAPLLIVAALVVVALSVIARGIAPIVAVPGAVLALWLPGHAISTAAAPRRVSFPERLVVDLVASIAVTILLGLVLGILGVVVERPAWAIGLAAVTVAAALVGWARHVGRSVDEEADAARAALAEPRPLRTSRRDTFLFALAALIVVAAFGVARLGAESQPTEPFSQLWMVPAAGDTVRVGIENHEHEATTYRLVLQGAGATPSDWSSIRLEVGQRWEREVRLAAAARPNARLVLYRADAPDQPYRLVALGPTASTAP